MIFDTDVIKLQNMHNRSNPEKAIRVLNVAYDMKFMDGTKQVDYTLLRIL